jgi:hypothetical protein
MPKQRCGPKADIVEHISIFPSPRIFKVLDFIMDTKNPLTETANRRRIMDLRLMPVSLTTVATSSVNKLP